MMPGFRLYKADVEKNNLPPFKRKMEEKLKQIKNYVYHVRILEMPEEIFWAQARAMNKLWNQMAEIRANFIEETKPLYHKEVSDQVIEIFRQKVKNFFENLPEKTHTAWLGKSLTPGATDQLKETQIKKLLWKMYDSKLFELIKSEEVKKQLGHEAREIELKRFLQASAMSLKNEGTIDPKPARVNQISFYHRFPRKGLNTDRIFLTKSKKVRLESVPEKYYLDEGHRNRKSRYSRGVFGIGIGDHPLKISVYLHRPIPSGIIKAVFFTGKFSDITREWTWKIIFTVETEVISEMPRFLPLAALHLSWRRIKKEFLRIGYIKDTAGNSFEIRLPLIEKPNRRAQNALTNVNRARERKGLELLAMNDLFPSNFFEVNDWRSQADLLKDKVKSKIKVLYTDQTTTVEPLPDHAEDFLKRFNLIGRGGLLKLKWQIEQIGEENQTSADSEVLALLAEYAETDSEKRIAIHKTEDHLKNKRKKLYESLALWLKKNYSHLIWNEELSLQNIAKQSSRISLHSDDAGFKTGNKFRNFAGLSVLRTKLKEHHQPGGVWLISVKPTELRNCHICGAETESNKKLVVTCHNGHKFDQNANICKYMLDSALAEKINSSLIFSSKKEEIPIPDHLQKYIIPVVD